MQDRTSANSMKVLLQRAAGPYIGVRSGKAQSAGYFRCGPHGPGSPSADGGEPSSTGGRLGRNGALLPSGGCDPPHGPAGAG
jgi:hypothetical protein